MASRRLRSILTTCTALALLSVAAEASAQDAATTEQSGTTLRPITLKGTRVKAGDVENTPTATETTEAQLEKKQVASIEDLGRSIDPGVNFDRRNNSVNIRGLDSNRVTTLVDGIPLTYFNDNARGTNGGTESFDFFALTTVNVVKGADSSRIGDGALGGALLLRTLEPEDLIGEGKDWGGKVGTGFDSADNSRYGGVALAKKIENTSVLFLGSYKKGDERDNKGDVGGFGSARTKTNPAEYDQYNMMFKLRQDLEGGHRVGVTAEKFRFDKDIDLKQAQTPGTNYRPEGKHTSGDENERTRVSLDYEYEAPSADGLIDAAKASLYWQKQERTISQDSLRFGTVAGPFKRNNDMSEAGIGFNGFFDSGFDTGAVDHVFTLGTSMFFSKAEQYSAGVDSCDIIVPTPSTCANLHTNQSDMPDVDSSKFSIYAQDRMTFGDSGFSLTPGIRFDWYKHDPKETASFLNNAMDPTMPPGSSDSAISPKLLAEYKVNDDVTLFAQWAMGFRSPTANELYLTYGAPSTYLSIGNPDLKPETSHGFDIGARLGDGDFGGSVNLFYNKYRNFIDSRNLTIPEQIELGITPGDYFFVQRQVNLAKVEIYGVELAAHKNFANGFNVRGGLSYVRGEDKETGDLLASVAPLKAVLGLGYATDTWGVDALWTGVKHVDERSTASFKAPGYGLVDLTAWWEPEQVKGLSIRAGVYNVFDRKYWDALYTKDVSVPPDTKDYFTEPGRTFKISLTQRF